MSPASAAYWNQPFHKTTSTTASLPPVDILEQALCAQTDPEEFFPEKGGSTKRAKAICQACPVRTSCLEWAIGNGERFGVWGGLSERQRRKLRDRTADAA